MKIVNTRFGVLNTSRGGERIYAIRTPNYKNIALYGAIIALVAIYVARGLGWV